MLKTIGAWVRSVYASYTLYRVEKGLYAYQEQGEFTSAIEKLDEAMKDIPAILAKAKGRKKGLKLDFSTKWWRGDLRMEFFDEERIGKIRSFTPTGPFWKLTLGGWETTAPYQRALGGPNWGDDPVEVIRSMLTEKRANLVKEQARVKGVVWTDMTRKNFVELAQLQKMLRPLVSGKPKQRVTDMFERFPIELAGWPYIENVQEAEKKLDDAGWVQVEVRLKFKDRKDWTGLWERYGLRLTLVIPSSALKTRLSVAGFHQHMARLEATLDHELQHFGQDALAIIKGLPEDAGLPGESLRDPTVSPGGVPHNPKERRKTKDKRIEHSLRDVEFYPNLRSSLQDFIEVLPGFPRDQYDAVAREFVGVDPPKLLRYPNYRFKALRDKAPAKWQKAIKEFLKAVERLPSHRTADQIAQRVLARWALQP